VFSSRADHSRFHNLGCKTELLLLQSDGSYICTKSSELIAKTTCPLCGSIKDKSASLCIQCSRRKMAAGIPDKQLLIETIRKHSGNFVATGKFFGVTDNAVRKWCKKYQLDHHSKSYRA